MADLSDVTNPELIGEIHKRHDLLLMIRIDSKGECNLLTKGDVHFLVGLMERMKIKMLLDDDKLNKR